MPGPAVTKSTDSDLLPVSISVSILAVLLALISLLAHRAHTHTIFAQNQTNAEWVYYESKAAGRTSYDALLDFLPVAQLRDPASAGKVKEEYQRKMQESDEEQKKIKELADTLEMEVSRQQNAADRFDLGHVCLEAALVIVSITLLTKRRLYWAVGLGVACVGLAVASTGFFV